MADAFAWKEDSPESRHLCGSVLEAMRQDLAERGTRALLAAPGAHLTFACSVGEEL